MTKAKLSLSGSMTKEDFELFWKLSYPESVPVSHCLRQDYKTCWFRIHSLPESKRYATTTTDWSILLTRQNQIITDLLGENSRVLLVTGEYNKHRNDVIHSIEIEEVFKPYRFSLLDSIKVNESETSGLTEFFYRPAIAEITWADNQFDLLLKALANNKVRALFVSTTRHVIVAPYDGGIDFILNDDATKNFYKFKYQSWLSEREDGL